MCTWEVREYVKFWQGLLRLHTLYAFRVVAKGMAAIASFNDTPELRLFTLWLAQYLGDAHAYHGIVRCTVA